MSGTDADSSFIAQALPAFISEAHEQIEMLEQLLLKLEDDPQDRELLDALFRCAHTVKGSAGIFGLDRVVAFTHHVETVLDRLREGKVVLNPELNTLLLQCNDQIRALVAAAQQPVDTADDGAAQRAALVARLQAVGGAAPAATPGAVDANGRMASHGDPCWHLSARFGVDTFRNGMDPLAILTYVAGLGEVAGMACDTELVPALESLDPESCRLAFRFELHTRADRQEIESAFSFVREDCALELTQPAASRVGAVEQIEALPDHPKLGDILMSAGAITRTQLQQGLDLQAQSPQPLSNPVPIGEILQARTGVSAEVVDAALRKQAQQRQPAASGVAEDHRFIRVQADRLDAVINLLGELVTASAGASMLAHQVRNSGLIEAAQQIHTLVEEIRNGTLQLRMVPIGETFHRFRRVVRDTAAELGKDVVLEVVGGDTELDKSVVERVADPLMHLVRNALDHGLETPAQRQSAGKTAQGKLTLAASHESGGILIRIIDDGRGIDREKVLERAWQRGLVPQGVVPSDADILKLIFEAGFSTAERVTNLSGRGVGMDVVRRNIEALRGSVTVFSEPDAGSRIEIRLPLTLAIIDGFLVSVGTSKFIFPLDAVVEVIERREPAAEFDASGRGTVELRGQVLPVVSLRSLYELGQPEPDRSSVVVLRAGAQRYGVLVDQLLGQHQTVIKPLGRMLRSLKGMFGSSILGNGEVALIFDVQALCTLAAQPAQLRAAGDRHRSGSSRRNASLEGQPS